MLANMRSEMIQEELKKNLEELRQTAKRKIKIKEKENSGNFIN